MTAPTTDRRLFGFAAGVWVASLVALRVSPTTAWRAAAVTAGLAALVGGAEHVARRRMRDATAASLSRRRDGISGRPARYRPRHLRPVGFWALAAVLLGAVCGFTATAARTSARDAAALAAIVQQHPAVRVRLVVTGDPQVLTPSIGRAGGPTSLLVPANLTRVDTADGTRLALDVRVLVFASDPAWAVLLPSQVVEARGRLGTARGGDLTAAVLSATGPPEPAGPPQWTQSAAAALRAGLRRAVAPLPAAPGGLLPGLAIGDTSLLDPGLAEEFRTTGLTHLTAVSGANITIIVGFVLLLARWLRAGPRLAAVLAFACLVGFVILVRPSPSVVRAAAMGAIGLLALVVGRSRIATAALAAAVAGSLLVDPALAVDAGFLLSVLATGALVLVAPGWRDRLRNAGVPSGFAEALAVPAAAQVVCAPVIVALSGRVSLVALPANVLAAPAVAPATVLGVAAAAISPVWSTGAEALAWLGSWPARWLVLVAQLGARVPSGSFGWIAGWPGALSLAALCAGIWLGLRHRASRSLVLVVLLAAAAGAAPVRLLAGGWPPAGAVLVVCDVGQGDAIVLPDGDGHAVMVDTGPDPVPVDGCLRGLGVVTLDVVIISHFHADHIDGLAGVLRGRNVAGVVVPTLGEPVGGGEQVRRTAQQASVPVVEVGAGWTLRDDDIELRAIGPTRRLTSTHSDPNNNSLVLLARVRGISILLPGDAEVEEQQVLLRELDADALRVDVLKVAHHGSSYQDEQFVDATRARVALVSVGAGNPYGHPSEALLRHLSDTGMRVLRTDRDGDLAVVITADGLGVVAHPPA